MQKVKNVTEKVEFILKNFPDTRNSDYKLCVHILGTYKLYIWDVDRVTLSLSVVKIRQKLQLQGKYPANEEVKAKRHAYSKFFKEAYLHGQKQLMQKISLQKASDNYKRYI